MQSDLSRNIPLLYCIKLCKWFMLYMPVIKLFYVENNLDNFELLFLHAVYSVIIATFEIPSGYVADMWGRKKALIIGLAFGLLGFWVYSISFGFLGFLLAEIALGIGEGFISGTDTALLYDSLDQQDKRSHYLKHEGRISASGNMAEAMAGIAVTLLAFTTIRYYYYLQTLLTCIALFASFWLVEPYRIVHKSQNNWKAILAIVRNSLITNKHLSNYLIFSSIIGFASLMMAWFAQIYLYEAGVKPAQFGVLWTILNLFVFMGSFMAATINRWITNRQALWGMLIVLSGGFLVASQTISTLGIVFLTLFYFARGVAHPILKDRINTLTSSDIRATVLSIRSLIIRCLFSVLGPLLGLISEKINLATALVACGLSVFIFGIIFLILIFKTQKEVF